MFIFSSNAPRYTFEYKLSKTYRIENKERLKISPSVIRVEHYSSVKNYTDPNNSDAFSITTSINDVTLRDLVSHYDSEESIAVSANIFDVVLREVVIDNTIAEETQVFVTIHDVELKNNDISHPYHDDAMFNVSIIDINLT